MILRISRVVISNITLFDITYSIDLPFKRQIHKMVKHTQTNRRQIADDLFECV